MSVSPTPEAEATTAPFQGQALTVANLGIEHHGWYIRLSRLPEQVAARHIVLAGIRRWTHDGVDLVGLLDSSTKSEYVIGSEYVRRADDSCTLDRRVTKTKPRIKFYETKEAAK